MFKLHAHYTWEVGMYFSTKGDFKEAIISYAFQSGRKLKFSKNDKIRVRVRCKYGCEWESYCAKFPNEDYWQLNKVVNIHSCNKEYNVKLISTK